MCTSPTLVLNCQTNKTKFPYFTMKNTRPYKNVVITEKVCNIEKILKAQYNYHNNLRTNKH